LHTAEGDALLSDFGAAAFFDVNDALLAQGLEKLEVRAIGCLFQELAIRCDIGPHETNQHQTLTTLAQQCLCEKIAMRPSMAQVSNTLEALMN
jgi:hypothetical protein